MFSFVVSYNSVWSFSLDTALLGFTVDLLRMQIKLPSLTLSKSATFWDYSWHVDPGFHGLAVAVYWSIASSLLTSKRSPAAGGFPVQQVEFLNCYSELILCNDCLTISSSIAWCFRGGFFNRCVLILSLQAVFFQAILLNYYSVSDIISLFYWSE